MTIKKLNSLELANMPVGNFAILMERNRQRRNRWHQFFHPFNHVRKGQHRIEPDTGRVYVVGGKKNYVILIGLIELTTTEIVTRDKFDRDWKKDTEFNEFVMHPVYNDGYRIKTWDSGYVEVVRKTLLDEQTVRSWKKANRGEQMGAI